MAVQRNPKPGEVTVRGLNQQLSALLTDRTRTLLHQIWIEASPEPSSLGEPDTVFMLLGQAMHRFSGAELAKALAAHQWTFRLFNLVDEHYDVQRIDDDSALATGVLQATMPSSAAEETSFTVLGTLVWRLGPGDDDVRLAFCQMTITETSSVAHPAVHAGVPTSMAARTVPSSPPIALHTSDMRGTTHWVDPDQVVYVAAAHQYTNVYCIDRLVRMRAPFGKVLEQLGNVVVQVHRSYAVNPAHVRSLEGEELHLTNGAKIAIPARRAREVRELLSQNAANVGA